MQRASEDARVRSGLPFRTKVPTVGFDGNQGWDVASLSFRLVCPRK